MKSKEQKRLEAAERDSLYNSLSTTEKLKKLDTKLGTGQGATKQRKRLANLLKG